MDFNDDIQNDQQQPSAEPAQQPAKVTFDERQQAKINELIREAQGRAAKETRAELARTKQELEAARRATPQADPGVAELGAQVAALKAERDALAREKTEASVTNQLRQHASNFIDADLAVQLMRANTRMIDGKVTVVDASGNERLNTSTMEPMSVAELAAEMEQARPYLVRSQFKGGTGSTEGTQYTGNRVSDDQLKRLFGRNSDSRAANDLSKRSMRTYRAMKEEAKKRGII